MADRNRCLRSAAVFSGNLVGHEAAIVIGPQQLVKFFGRVLVCGPNVDRIFESVCFFNQAAREMQAGAVARRTQHVEINSSHVDLRQSASALQHDFSQHRHRSSCAAFLPARTPCGSGNIEVGPA